MKSEEFMSRINLLKLIQVIQISTAVLNYMERYLGSAPWLKWLNIQFRLPHYLWIFILL